MKCQLVQTRKVDDRNVAEKEMLAFLSNLPADYFVYRELQVNADYRKRLAGVQKKKPDFVVVAPTVGLMSVEVKDWNLTENEYVWQDQYEIRVTALSTGKVDTVTNPAAQADDYLWALKELVSGLKVYITSLVAFPRVTRAEFLNRLKNLDVRREAARAKYGELVDL